MVAKSEVVSSKIEPFALIAKYLFDDPLTVRMVIGIGLIVAGVLTIELVGAAH